MNRREFLATTASVAGAWLAGRPAGADPESDAWDAGALTHLIPAASHDRILLKASFREPLTAAPRLRVGSRSVEGVATDTRGRFWRFDALGLAPGASHRLALEDAAGGALCEPWPLATFPPPDARPERFRLLVYTCAGGDDRHARPDGTRYFVPLALRRRALRRGLSFRPHAVLGIGDHVYMDQVSGMLRALREAGPAMRARLGQVPRFDRSMPVLGFGPNEALFVGGVDPQIASLYGTLLRSVPTLLSQDDHDYFEDDRANERVVTFPPDPFALRLARATQRLYYPEFLPGAGRPAGLAGSGAADRPPGTSESFGSLRFGDLAELMVYDCRRFLSLKGPTAGFVPEAVEAWLRARMAAGDTRHVVNVPSTPIAWSAGKWGEWYPDVRESPDRVGRSRPKPYWQSGWLAQHDRLLAAASGMDGIPLFVSGDLHALGVARIHRSGALDLRERPVVSVLSGPLGTGAPGWPSRPDNRGVRPQPPTDLEVDEELPCLERNGFSLVDFTRDAIRIRMFRWEADAPPESLDGLEPFHQLELARET